VGEAGLFENYGTFTPTPTLVYYKGSKYVL
jgi:hypothetical protein